VGWRPPPAARAKQKFQIAIQVVDAVCGHRRAAGGLGQDESALQNRLRVQRKRSSAPVGRKPTGVDGRPDVGFQRGGVAGDAARAGVAKGRDGLIGLLHHGADEAGEFRYLALQQSLAEGNVAEHALQRIGVVVIRRSGKQRAGDLRPVIRRRYGQRILAPEMMEESALGDARCRAKLIDAGRRIAFGPHHRQRRIEQLRPGIGLCGGSGHRLFLFEVRKYRPVGMLSIARAQFSENEIVG